MNVSFTVLGLTTALGAIALRPRLMPGKLGLLSTSLFVASGIGVAMVGQNPENLAVGRHILGAYLNAFGACFGVLLMGFAVRLKGRWPRFGTLNIMAGVILLALALAENIGFYTQIPFFSLGLGQGGMEKLFDYMVYVWLILVGAYLLIMQTPDHPGGCGSPSDAA